MAGSLPSNLRHLWWAGINKENCELEEWIDDNNQYGWTVAKRIKDTGPGANDLVSPPDKVVQNGITDARPGIQDNFSFRQSAEGFSYFVGGFPTIAVHGFFRPDGGFDATKFGCKAFYEKGPIRLTRPYSFMTIEAKTLNRNANNYCLLGFREYSLDGGGENDQGQAPPVQDYFHSDEFNFRGKFGCVSFGALAANNIGYGIHLIECHIDADGYLSVYVDGRLDTNPAHLNTQTFGSTNFHGVGGDSYPGGKGSDYDRWRFMDMFVEGEITQNEMKANRLYWETMFTDNGADPIDFGSNL